MKFEQVYELDKKLTKQYIASLDKEQRIKLIEPLVKIVLSHGLVYPDDKTRLIREFNNIVKHKPDINKDEVYNNSSVGTYICKYFCKDFYSSKGPKDKKTIEEILKDEHLVKKLVSNRLGLDWYNETPGLDGTFTLSPKMMIQGIRSMRLISQITIFKPTVYKFLVEKFSNENDVVFDYSCGWGARMLATIASKRKYIGTDPLTVPDLIKMKDFFKLSDVTLIQSGSEDYIGKENSVDFSCSSPPYFNQEVYSDNKSQAYNNGEDYFYNVYWKKTLQNIKFMLKPNKYFGLNVINFPKMLEVAREIFDQEIQIIKLKTTRSHLNKVQGKEAVKYEPVYIFKNNKP